VITDATRPNPQNSYGSQKLMLETFYADLARRDSLSVRTLRLMTVSVRPGKPNQAASGFLSGMIREPLSGLASNVPVPLDTQVALNSPEEAVDGLIQAMGISDQAWGTPLGMNLPGMRLSIQEMRDALKTTAGPQALDLLTYDRDPMIGTIVAGWPSHFESARANRLGFRSTESFEEVVQRFQTTK
ncbi:MAG: NAD-dependent epimerase, partial [Litoricolaceae bacterium]|nr:NAD-dependent epimerase [Litorivicinaceae bacterium]